jgi:hypothetical protein
MTASASSSSSSRALLRHGLATIAYRGGKAVTGAPDSFAGFRACETTRTPGQILAHISDVLDWGLSIAAGNQVWTETPPQPWPQEVARFHASLQAFDDYLASDAELHASDEKLLQGPIADSLTHVGQIAMLRRLAGGAIRGENYYKAEIAAGRVGAEQAAPKLEF